MTFLDLSISDSVYVADPFNPSHRYVNSGVYALVESLPESLYVIPQDDDDDGDNYLAHQCTRLVYKSGVSIDVETNQPSLYLVEVSTMFVEPCVAVPYNPNQPDGNEYLVLEQRSRWDDVLYDWMGELLDPKNN